MAAFKSQVIYGFTGDSKPVLVGKGEDQSKVVGHSDFLEAVNSSEQAIGQMILQDNNEVVRQNNLISEQGLTSLDPGSATLPDVINEINKYFSIISNLNAASKE